MQLDKVSGRAGNRYCRERHPCFSVIIGQRGDVPVRRSCAHPSAQRGHCAMGAPTDKDGSGGQTDNPSARDINAARAVWEQRLGPEGFVNYRKAFHMHIIGWALAMLFLAAFSAAGFAEANTLNDRNDSRLRFSVVTHGSKRVRDGSGDAAGYGLSRSSRTMSSLAQEEQLARHRPV